MLKYCVKHQFAYPIMYLGKFNIKINDLISTGGTSNVYAAENIEDPANKKFALKLFKIHENSSKAKGFNILYY